MNVKLFRKLIMSLTAIGLVSYYFLDNTPEDGHTLGSIIASLPALIIMSPFLLWHLLMKFDFPSNNGYYLAAAFFDIILYSFVIERIMTSIKNWRDGKNT